MATKTKDRFTKEQLDLIFLEESTYKFNEAAGDYVVCRIFNNKGELVDTITSRKFLKEYNDDVNVGRHNHIFTVTDVLQNGYTTTYTNNQNLTHNHDIINGVVQEHCADYDSGGGIISKICHSHDDLPIYLDVYKDEVTDKIYVKPNEVLLKLGVDEGNYTLEFEFIRDVFSDVFREPENYLKWSNLTETTNYDAGPYASQLDGWRGWSEKGELDDAPKMKDGISFNYDGFMVGPSSVAYDDSDPNFACSVSFPTITQEDVNNGDGHGTSSGLNAQLMHDISGSTAAGVTLNPGENLIASMYIRWTSHQSNDAVMNNTELLYANADWDALAYEGTTWPWAHYVLEKKLLSPDLIKSKNTNTWQKVVLPFRLPSKFSRNIISYGGFDIQGNFVRGTTLYNINPDHNSYDGDEIGQELAQFEIDGAIAAVGWGEPNMGGGGGGMGQQGGMAGGQTNQQQTMQESGGYNAFTIFGKNHAGVDSEYNPSVQMAQMVNDIINDTITPSAFWRPQGVLLYNTSNAIRDIYDWPTIQDMFGISSGEAYTFIKKHCTPGDVIIDGGGYVRQADSTYDVGGVKLKCKGSQTWYITGAQLQKGILDEGFQYTTDEAVWSEVELEEEILKDNRFYITEISPTRKEVRLIVRNNLKSISFNDGMIARLKSIMGDFDNTTYEFNYVMTLDDGKSISINNYTFDDITDPNASTLTGDGVTLILRLNEPIPQDTSNLDVAYINRRVLNSTSQEVYYVDNELDFAPNNLGLVPDVSVLSTLESNEGGQDNYHSQEDLIISSSLGEDTLDKISFDRLTEDVNLNVDFNYFKNHTFFGSATKKLENFKYKVGKIQNHLTEISKSLNTTKGKYILDDKEIIYNGNFLNRTGSDNLAATEELSMSFAGWSDTRSQGRHKTRYNSSKQAVEIVIDETSQSSAAGTIQNYKQRLVQHVAMSTIPAEHKGWNAGFPRVDDWVRGSKYLISAEFKTDIREDVDITMGWRGFDRHSLVQSNHKPWITGSNHSVNAWGSEHNVEIKGVYSSSNGWTRKEQVFTPPLSGSLVNPYFCIEFGKTGWRYSGSADRFGSIYSNGTDKSMYHLQEQPHTLWIRNVSMRRIAAEEAPEWMINRRKLLFKKIQDIKNTFTPYERWLYNDAQSTSTGSMPSLGKNLAKKDAMNSNSSHIQAFQLDGFNKVYKTSTHMNRTKPGRSPYRELYRWVGIMHNDYFVEDAPFYNYSGSLYLSFLMKGDDSMMHKHQSASQNDTFFRGPSFENSNTWNTSHTDVRIPYRAKYGATSNGYTPGGSEMRQYEGAISRPMPTGSQYKRYVFEVSNSYWKPIVNFSDSGFNDISDYFYDGNRKDGVSTRFEYLTNKEVTGSTDYIDLASYTPFYDTFPKQQDGFSPFIGSVKPMGELFRLSYCSGSIKNYINTAVNAVSGTKAGGQTMETSSFITDVKITMNTPEETLPFSNIYTTSSTTFDNWYTQWHATASAYDAKNIHSLENNLPSNIQTDPENKDLVKFLHMWGEHFDLMRNYIDGYSTFYKRNYHNDNSVPKNLMPILADHLGWELINPFSSSMANYFGEVSSSATSGKSLMENTWRKSINNLIYLYKTKGTKNSLRALLNTYGYPPDFLEVDEYGGSLEEHNPSVLTQEIEALTDGVGSATGSISFVRNNRELYAMDLSNRKLNLDWGTNDVSGSCVEFIFSATPSSSQDMVLLKNSGSGTQNMWDLRLIATGSTNEFSSSAYGITPSASLQFRINNTANGASAIAANAFSCSTQPLPLKDGDLWSVLIQQNINNKYNLWVGKQDGSAGDKIEYFNQGLVKQGDVTSSILEITDADTNTNFKGFGGLSGVNVGHGNLVVGEYFTGSMAEIRVWKTALSASKFKQHILNKDSVTGNTLNSHNTDLIYQYKLNENYIPSLNSDQSYFESGSDDLISYTNDTNDLTQSIKDAVPENVKDYSFETYFNLRSGSLYTSYNIETVAFSPRIGGAHQPNTNKIITRPNQPMIQDLSPIAESVQSPYDELSNKRKPSNKISILKSPQKLLDFHIINKIADMDVSDKFGSPADLYEDSYKDLQALRDIVFKGVSVKINKYIEAQKSIFTPSLISAVNEVIPVRAEKEVGVAIKPDLLQRSKYKWTPLEIQSGSQAGNFTMEVDASNILTLTQSTQEAYYESNEIYATGSSPVMENNPPYESNEISGSPASVSSEELSQNEATIIISASDFSATKIDVKGDDIVATGSTITMTDVETFDDKNGTINLSHNYVKFKLPWKDIDGNDYQFPQYQEGFEGSRQNKGKDGDYNVGFFERNMIFKTIGDYEMLSASANSVGTGIIDFENERYFLNKELDDFGNERGRTSQISSSIKKDGVFDIETLHYPKNHWINYHTPKEQLHIYKGTQGTGSKFTVEDPRKLDIYPTMSFYTIEVGGSNTDNTLKVIRNKDGKGAKGRR